jgi:hypothetical protein
MVAFGPGLVGHRRECFTALAAFQVGEVQAQQIGGTVNESAMRAFPCWRFDVVAAPLRIEVLSLATVVFLNSKL